MVLYAHEFGLVPITTPAYIRRATVLPEAVVKTFKSDYVDGAERDAKAVLAQLRGWTGNYNTLALRSALGIRRPAEYRAEADSKLLAVSRKTRSTPRQSKTGLEKTASPNQCS